SHFIFLFHPDAFYGHHYIAYQEKPLTNKEYLAHWGKWVVFGMRPEFDVLAQKLDPYVDKGIIPCAKYDRVPLKHLGLEECVLCVYCDDRQRDKVWNILAESGVNLKAWFYERETLEMWSPGGRLLENWIASQNLSEEEAENVREDARQRVKAIYEEEEAIFTGWEQ
ncbi:MAG TPA: hypothetical protein DHV84_06015, partial [Desulfotomaculum sp.]|nr:hypothetical protein [Desulfotomaculum sp.]